MIVKIGEFTGSSITNFDMDNIFSSQFDVYDIKFNSVDLVDGTNSSWKMRFIDSAGSVVSGSTYSSTGSMFRTDSDSWSYSNSQNDITYANLGFRGGYSDDTEGMCSVTVFDPYNSSVYTTVYSEVSAWYSSGFVWIYKMANVEKTQQAIRGVRFYGDSNFNSVSATVYGIEK